MIDYSKEFGELPNRMENHVKNDRGRLAFKCLFRDPLFIVREELDNDYGVDISVEALINDGKSPTNILTRVQLKSSSKAKNKDGSYSYCVAIANINYMINHPCSFYAFYSINEDKLYYNSTENVYSAYNLIKSKRAKSISIKFSDELNMDAIKLINQNMLDTAILFKDLRLKLHEGGFKPGSKLVYGELLFESSADSFEVYLAKNENPYVYTTDENG